jgi:hypothetical protein
MLKDVYDSKRINAHLHSDPNFKLDTQQFPSTALILSAQFWPPFKEETLELPNFVKEHLQIYTKAFETLKVIFIYIDSRYFICCSEHVPLPYFLNVEVHTAD